MNKKILLPIILLVVVFLAVPFASKAFVAKSGDSVLINETIEGNFFGAGNLVSVAGTVNGDVFVAGNNVTITGTINGDVFVAASSIEISGQVNGNVRAVGSNINIRGLVEKNVLAAGASLLISESASIGRHLTFGGASLIVNAPVGGQIDVGGESVILNNSVGGDVMVKLESDGGLVLMSNANLNGNLNYESIKEAKIETGALISGNIDYKPWQKKARKVAKGNIVGFLMAGFIIGKLISLISLFIIGLILIYLMPQKMEKTYDLMKKKFWPSIGWGLIILILTPIVCFILLFTIVGIPISIIVMFLYSIALYLSKVVGGYAVGKWISEKLKWKVNNVVSLIIGLIVMTLIILIPFAGWIVGFFVFLWALGGIYHAKKECHAQVKK